MSKEYCKDIIDLFNINSQYVDEYDTDVYKFHQLNLNKNRHLLDHASHFASSLVPYYEKYFKGLGLREYVDINAFEEVRIKKYIKGSTDEFKTHVDITDKESAVRSCIAIMYLNDNDGFTTFPKLNIKVKPKAGRLIIFPPTWMFPHNGLTPTNDDKYIIITSLHYS